MNTLKLLLAGVLALGVGCTKVRDASFPDGAGEDVFKITDFTTAEVTLLTSSDTLSKAKAGGPAIQNVAEVATTSGDGIQLMFKDLAVPGAPQEKYGVRFKVSKGFVTAYKVLATNQKASALESSISHRDAGGTWIPIFQYRVDRYGKVVKSKNDLGEETQNLRFQVTPFDEATHVQVQTATSNRLPVGFPDGQGEDFFAMGDIQATSLTLKTGSNVVGGQVSVKEVQGALPIKGIFKDLSIRGKPDTSYTVTFRLNQKTLTAYKNADDADSLSDLEKDILITDEKGGVLVPIFQVPVIQYGSIVRSKNSLGEESHSLRFEPMDWEVSTYVQISNLSSSRQAVSFPDGADRNLIALNQLTSSEVKIKTTEKGSDGKVGVKITNAPEFMKPMFTALRIHGEADAEFVVKIEKDEEFLHAYRVVENPANLSEIEKNLLHGTNLVPIFKYSMGDYGVLKLVKDTEGRETYVLKFEETEMGLATHARVSLLTADRLDLKFPDGADEHLFARSDLESIVVRIKTGASENAPGAADSVRADRETERLSIAQIQAPAAMEASLRGAMSGFKMMGAPQTEYELRFELGQHFLTAYKVDSNLNTQEAQLAVVKGGVKMVPVFQLPVGAFGIVTLSKTFGGAMSSTLQFKQSEWVDATHVRLEAFSNERRDVEVPSSSQKLADQIFLKDKVNGGVFTRADLKKLFELEVAAEDGVLYQAKIDSQGLKLFEITTLDSDRLSDRQREIIKDQDEGGPKRFDLARCSADLVAKLPAGSDPNDCIVVLRYEAAIQFIAVELDKVDGTDEITSSIRYIDAPNGALADLVKIAKNATLFEIHPAVQDRVFDSARTLVVEKMKNQEFMFRRTLEDSPSAFRYTFAGAAGKLEIVRFLFEEEQVRVIRSRSLVAGGGGTGVDLETLLAIPVAYFKEVWTDPHGNRLATPRLLPSDHTESGTIAIVDWEANAVPNVASPLNYYGVERCFTGARSKEISEVDQRTEEGMLSFSLASTYASNPMIDCVGLGLAGYFDTVQVNFTFKERFSFKKLDNTNENPILELPYLAQKRLGFGLFTFKKKVANDFGNSNKQGSEIALPAIFNLNEQKQRTYVLAGLPESGPMREAIIQASREVVDDWNEGFRRALKGSPLETTGDVLKFEVEGEESEPRKLGDLDRNYIYFIQKKTESPIIGLGGSHSNPRSGEVEAASVFLYGGNILGFVERIKEVAIAELEYREKSKIEIPEQPQAEEVVAGGGSDAAGGGGTASGSSDLSVIGSVHPDSFKRVGKLVDSKVLEHFHEHPEHTKDEMAHYADLLKNIGGGGVQKPNLEEVGGHEFALGFYETVQEIASEGGFHNPEQTASILNRNFLKLLQGKVSSEEMEAIRAKAVQDQSLQMVKKNMHEAGICLYEFDHAKLNGQVNALLNAGLTKEQIIEMDPIELLVAVYKPTLAHEIGHNLGLRHNFISSFDKANWKFEDEQETPRTYSSVMDYLTDDHLTYDGVGPQDVAALRAAYGQMLELHASEQAKVVELDGKTVLPLITGETIPVVDGKLISIADYKTALGLEKWEDLDYRAMARVRLKSYGFCSDEDAGWYPLCNRFDNGTSPQEIVKNISDNYKAMYSLRNFPNDRLRFDWTDMGSYLGRLFSQFIRVRQFLEETIYQLINGAPQEVVSAYLSAAVDGLFFLQDVVRTPDAPSFAQGDQRWVTVELTGGLKIPVERKWLKNIADSDISDRLRVRGIEFDKVIALIFLTERRLGFPRYERVSLRISYPELERLLLPDEKLENLPTMALLNEILKDNIRPAVSTPLGRLALSDGRFKADTSELIRIYGVIGSILALDVNGLEAKDNLSADFRVLSDFVAPEGVESTIRPGATAGTPSELRYWAGDQAGSAGSLISSLNVMAQVNRAGESLGDKMLEWVRESLKAKAEEAAEGEGEGETGGETGGEAGNEEGEEPPVEEPTRLETLTKEINEVLATLPEEAGPRTMEELGAFMLSVIDTAQVLDMLGSIFPPDVIADIVDGVRTQTGTLAKNAPTMALAITELRKMSTELQSVYLTRITPYNPLEVNRGVQFSNLEILNQIFYAIHPEYKH